MGKVTILEGPDGAGKTTLAAAWRNKLALAGLTSNLSDHGPYLDQTGDFISTRYLRSLLMAANSPHVFLDRSWFSEEVYGPIVRGVDRMETRHHRVLERVAFSRSAVQLICLPPYENCLKAYLARKEMEYLEDESILRAVWDNFRALTTLDKPQRIPTFVYDYTREPDLQDFIDLVEGLRPPPNLGPGLGHFRNGDSTLIIHEHNLPVTPDMWLDPAWKMLNQELEMFYIPERSLYWVGAIGAGGNETKPDGWIDELAPKKVVAMGALAWAWCKRNGITAKEIPSHDWWFRFRAGDEFSPLRDAFK